MLSELGLGPWIVCLQSPGFFIHTRGWKSTSEILLVFVNKILLEYRGVHHLHYGCLCATAVELSRSETVWLTKPKVFAIWTCTTNICQPLVYTLLPWGVFFFYSLGSPRH